MSAKNVSVEAGGAETANSAHPSSPTVSDTRKRGRSPPGTPFVSDYRPYGSGLLQLHRRTQTAEMHRRQWDLYYRNNTVNGYKDRHYILREFHELRSAIDAAADAAVREHATADGGTAVGSSASFAWMEAGCGVGNAMLPVFEQYGHLPQWRALLGFDISAVAVRLLEEKRAALPPALAAKVHVCVLNPSESDVADCTFFHCPAGVSPPTPLCAFPEFVSLIFVLCSIPVPTHALVLRRIAACMVRPGGVLYFRDYAVSDHAETRFQQRSGQRRPGRAATAEADGGEGKSDSATASAPDAAAAAASNDGDSNTYERTNGTLSHFFSVEEVRRLFVDAGFEVIALGLIENEVVNRKTGVSFARKFVQGRFRLLA